MSASGDDLDRRSRPVSDVEDNGGRPHKLRRFCGGSASRRLQGLGQGKHRVSINTDAVLNPAAVPEQRPIHRDEVGMVAWLSLVTSTARKTIRLRLHKSVYLTAQRPSPWWRGEAMLPRDLIFKITGERQA